MQKPIARLGVSLALGLGLTVAVLALAGSHVARASGPWYVSTTGSDSNDCLSAGTPCLTINGAVGKAADGDTINIAAGTYTENVSISGKALAFVGAGLGSTIVDGGGTDRVFDSDANLALMSLTLQNGNATGGDGGGAHTTGAVALSSVAVTSNTAFFSGGGLFANGPATVTASLFQNNSGAQGGGVYSANTLALSASTFISNTSPGWGGGARALLAMNVAASTFTHNSADSGGGLYADAVLTLADTQFFTNTSANFGGGAYLNDVGYLEGDSFSGNSSNSGGGADFNTSASVSGTTFITNTAANAGGGAYFNGAAVLTGTTFTQNLGSSSAAGGGGAVFGGAARLTNTGFNGNISHFAGGGAYFSLPAVLAGTGFINNIATTNRGGGAYFNDRADITGGIFNGNQTPNDRGAGAYFRGSAAITSTQFIFNLSANRAGGAYFFAPAVLSSTIFAFNQASLQGGGAYFGAAFLLQDGGFVSNTSVAQNGGGLFATGPGAGSLINEVFTSNQAGGAGNDLLLDNTGGTTLLHATLANSSTQTGAALVIDLGSLAVTNTIFANSQAGLAVTGTAAATSDYNLFFNAPTNAITGSHSLTGADPLFVNPAAFDYHLGAGSPAAGAGLEAGVSTDLDGAPRGNPPSIGAYELPAYTLALATAGTGSGTVSVVPSHSVYAQGTVLTLTATPDGGSVFAGWSGDVLSLVSPMTLTMDSDKSITATFNLAPPPVADLRLSLRGAPAEAPAGGTVTYTLVLTNTGPDLASTVRLTDTLGAGSTFQALSAPGGWSCQSPSVGAGGNVVCTRASLAASAPATFTLTVKLSNLLAPAALVTNNAVATTATSDPTTPNTASTNTQIFPYRYYLPIFPR